jgi:transketolase
MNTSEGDDFKIDDEEVMEGYNNKLVELKENKPELEKERDRVLETMLEQNINKHLNVFKRK